MAYLSALLWFTFLILSTALVAVHTLTEPEYFTQPYQLFPLWPEWHPEWAIALFSATALLLFLPKLLALMLLCAQRREALWRRLASGHEHVANSCSRRCWRRSGCSFTPSSWLPHSPLVDSMEIAAARRRRDDLGRSAAAPRLAHAARRRLGGGVYWLDPSYLWWLLPIVGALMLSIPLSVLTSRVSIGRWLRSAGLFVIPEELRPPPEIRSMTQNVNAAPRPPGFIEAVVDPVVNALMCASGVARFSEDTALRSGRQQLVRLAMENGPAQLTAAQKVRLLNDPVALSQLHLDVWTSPQSHAQWRDAIASSEVAGGIIGRVAPTFANELERSAVAA